MSHEGDDWLWLVLWDEDDGKGGVRNMSDGQGFSTRQEAEANALGNPEKIPANWYIGRADPRLFKRTGGH